MNYPKTNALLLLMMTLLAGNLFAREITLRSEIVVQEEEKQLIVAFIEHAVDFAKSRTPENVQAKCLESPETFAWVDFRYLNCLNTAYELTGDPFYLSLLRETFDLYYNILSTQQDTSLGWYGSPIPARVPADRPDILIDEIQMNFRAIAVIARWVELARTDAAFAEANNESIDKYLNVMEEHLFPKWDERGFYTELSDGTGTYHGLDFPLTSRVTLSFEKTSIILDGLLALYRITENPLYMERALRISSRFRQSLILTNDHYEWMSWMPTGKCDISPDKEDAWLVSWMAPDPRGEWYIAALSIALNMYQHGLLFTKEDLDRFINTQLHQCWNGDLESPEYRNVSGQTSDHIRGRFLSYQLAAYDKTLSTLAFHGPHEAEKLANVSNSWRGGANAQDYIRQKFIMAPLVSASPQPLRRFGDQFLSNPQNRKLHDELTRSKNPSETIVPRRPSQAQF